MPVIGSQVPEKHNGCPKPKRRKVSKDSKDEADGKEAAEGGEGVTESGVGVTSTDKDESVEVQEGGQSRRLSQELQRKASPQQRKAPKNTASDETAESIKPVITADALAGSLAHQKVTYRKSGNLFKFKFLRDGEVINFQTTVVAAGGCKEDAARIARFCYERLEAGATKEEVIRLRSGFYHRCQASRGVSASQDHQPNRPVQKQMGSFSEIFRKASKTPQSSEVRGRTPENGGLSNLSSEAASRGDRARRFLRAVGSRASPSNLRKTEEIVEKKVPVTKSASKNATKAISKSVAKPFSKAITKGTVKASHPTAEEAAAIEIPTPPLASTSENDSAEGASASNPSIGEAEKCVVEPAADVEPQPDSTASEGAVTTPHLNEDAPVDSPRITEDAPESSPAHAKVHWSSGSKTYWFSLPIKARVPGKPKTFQTTLMAAGDCHEDCQRIARLCYVKFEEGYSREQVLRFRAEMYRMCNRDPGERFRGFKGDVIVVEREIANSKWELPANFKPLAELECSDVDQLLSDDIVHYERDLGWALKRNLAERIARVEQLMQGQNTLVRKEQSQDTVQGPNCQPADGVSDAQLLQDFRALSTEQRQQFVTFKNIERLERAAHIPNAEFTMSERRSRLKEHLWASRATAGPKQETLFMQAWIRRELSTEGHTESSQTIDSEEEVADKDEQILKARQEELELKKREAADKEDFQAAAQFKKELENVEAELKKLAESSKEDRLRLETELEETRAMMLAAAAEDDFAKAIELKNQVKVLQEKLDACL